MRNMIAPAAAFAAVLVLLSAASAQYYVEADLNGVVGDPQPDYIVTTVGQEVPVDIWIAGLPGVYCCVFELYLCDPAHGLAYENTSFHWSGGGCWGYHAGSPDSSGCLHTFGSTAICFCEGSFPLPQRVATISYEAAADQTISEILLGPGSASFLMLIPPWSSWTQYFDNNGEVLARIQIGDVTAAEATSWGSIKTLFR